MCCCLPAGGTHVLQVVLQQDIIWKLQMFMLGQFYALYSTFPPVMTGCTTHSTLQLYSKYKSSQSIQSEMVYYYIIYIMYLSKCCKI